MENIGNIGSGDTGDDASDKKSEKTSKSTDKARDVGSIAGRAARERAADASERHEMPRILDRLLKPEPTATEIIVPLASESAGEPNTETESAHDTTPAIEESSERVPAPQGEYTGQLTELAPDETIYLADELVSAHQQELAEKPTSSDPAEAAADTVQAKLLEDIHDGLQTSETPPEQVMEETAVSIADEVETWLASQPIEASSVEPSMEQDDASEDSNPALVVSPVAAIPSQRPAAANAASSIPPIPGGPNNPVGSSNLNVAPPPPPVTPNIPTSFNMPPPGGPNIPYGAVAPNAMPSPDTVSAAEAAYQARRTETRGLVIGGLLGYLVGRRRGRIKTEKRLVPIQQKLEKQVKDLDNRLTSKEQDIRTLTTEKYRTAEESQRQELLEHMRPVERPQLTPDQQQQVTVAERSEPKVQLQAAEIALQQSVVQSAEKVLHQQQVEYKLEQPVEQKVKTSEVSNIDAPHRPTSEQVQRLQGRELAEAAEQVVIEGVSLRTFYESRQITEPGLRHVLSEYLRGGDVTKALTQELTIKEMTFERDPQSRDRIAADLAATASGSKASDDSRQQASPASQGQQSTAADSSVSPSSSGHTSQSGSSPVSKTGDNPMQEVLVRTWIVVIVILVIVAGILLLR